MSTRVGAWSIPPRIVAHRGASIEAPENTLAAFRAALEAGAPAVELDVHLAADGVPVVLHDDTLDRTTSGAGPVSERTSEEIARLDAGAWFGERFRGERVPTLAEALDFLHGRALVDVEVKTADRTYPGLVIAVEKAIRERWLVSDVVVSSFDAESVREAKARGLATALILPGEPMADEARAWGVFSDAFAIGEWAVTREVVEACAKPVYAWTVDDAARARALYEAGVAGVITNDPRGMRAVTRTG